MSPKKETAFQLDPARAGGDYAHVFGGAFPGLWRVDRPVHPEALGLTVARMRELVKEFSLPLVEVQVDDGTAHREFEIPPNHIPPSEPAAALEPEIPAVEPAEEPAEEQTA